MNSSTLKFVLLFLTLTTEDTSGNGDNYFKINAGRYFDGITEDMNDIFLNRPPFATSKNTEKIEFQGENIVVSLSGGRVVAIGEVSHSDVINKLHLDPTSGSWHPAFETTFRLTPKLMYKYHAPPNFGRISDRGEATLTISGVQVIVEVAVINSGYGWYTRLVNCFLTNKRSSSLSSFNVTGTTIADDLMGSALRHIYSDSPDKHLSLIDEYIRVAIAQEVVSRPFVI